MTMNIQEILKKAELYNKLISQQRPFEGHLLSQVKNFYRVATTWSSNALEGNTLTISETKVLIEDGITVSGKPLKDILEATGHAKSYDYMFSLLHTTSITEDNINMLHKLFYSGIDLDNAGKYRSLPVLITGSSYPVSKPECIPKEMQALCTWINEDRTKYQPIVFAAELHRRFVYIHPYIDGNGRTARLLMNTALIQSHYLPCVISPYIRQNYIAALEAAHKEPAVFTKFIVETEYETEKDFIRSLNLKMPDFKHELEPDR